MRILSVTQSYAPFYEFGGPPVKVEALAKGLVQREHNVTVLSADWGFEKRVQAGREAASSSRRSPFGWTREADGVQSIYLPTWFRYRAMTWNPAVGRYCRARLGQFDVVHIFGLYDLLGPAVARACRRHGVPYIVEPIGMFVPIVRNLPMKRVYHAIWGKKMLSGAAAVVATSEQEVDELVGTRPSGPTAIPEEKIVLRRNGVLVPTELPARGVFRAKHRLPTSDLVVLFLGRLSAKKSPDLLLEAFAKLPSADDGRTVRLVFAGPDEGGMQAWLENQARKLAVTDRVIFAGSVFGTEKWEAYRDADVFVLPSQNENFGNTAAEAAACGTPVVVTEGCGIAPLLAGTAGVVVRHETSEVAGAVKDVLFDGKLRERLAQGGRSAAMRLGWDGPVSEMERLYKSLTSSGRPVKNSAE